MHLFKIFLILFVSYNSKFSFSQEQEKEEPDFSYYNFSKVKDEILSTSENIKNKKIIVSDYFREIKPETLIMKTVFDFGSGCGEQKIPTSDFLQYLNKVGVNAYGIDICYKSSPSGPHNQYSDEDLLKYKAIQLSVTLPKAEFIDGIVKLPSQDQKTDYVLSKSLICYTMP